MEPDVDLKTMLTAQEPNFSAQCNLLGESWHSIGYHSQVPTGTWVHATRTSIYYALALLASGEAAWIERAPKVIRAVLASQVTDPYDPAFGIWPWLDEERVPQMAPPDWNWADFIGAALCHMLREYSDLLDDATKEEIRAALERAAWSIFRRNVQPEYTNIAIMGAAVTGAAAELLHIPLLLEYARRRLEKFAVHTEKSGGLTEYNSPTYTFVALFELERILQLIEDPVIREYATKLHEVVWGKIADHFHPLTGQLCGPQSRAYNDFLTKGTVRFLRWATGVEIPLGPQPSDSGNPLSFSYDGIRHLPCPEKIRRRFAELPRDEFELRECCIRRVPEENSFHAVAWFSTDATLGSGNRDAFWAQRRPMLGYWMADNGQPAVLKVRFLKDGRDCSAAGIWQVQRGTGIVFAMQMLTNLGDYHITLDRPPQGIYTFHSLAYSWELHAADAEVTEEPDGSFVMNSGAYKVRITPAPDGRFHGEPVKWRGIQEKGCCRVEAVLHDGAERSLAFDENLRCELGGALELFSATAEPSTGKPVKTFSEGKIHFTRDGLTVTAPDHAVMFQ